MIIMTMEIIVTMMKMATKRTEYYRKWEAAHREQRNAYRRKLYRLKRDQIKMEV